MASSRARVRLASLAALLSGSLLNAAPAQDAAPVPLPAVTGPIAGDAPGSADHNYTFMATDQPLGKYKYVEQEFFLSGTANTYDSTVPGGTGSSAVQAPTAGIVSANHPYKTNIVVRRPARAADFNGTVIVEWTNVTLGFNIEAGWYQSHDYMMKKGYAYVEVSAQSAGIARPKTGLKEWSPARYGSLDVTDGGTVAKDGLAFDIFSQAAAAIRANQGGVLGPLKAKHIIAFGISQSAGWLSAYLNAIQPRAHAFDGALVMVGGELIRPDLDIPVIKLQSESEFDNPASDNEIAVIQPDREGTGPRAAGGFRFWAVAGTSHVDRYFWNSRTALLARDLGPTAAAAPTCGAPVFSEVPIYMVENAAIKALAGWIETGKAPPHAPAFQLVSTTPPAAATDSFGVNVARDADHNALGAIRLPQMAAPTGTNTGSNSGGQLCFLNGTALPFGADRLKALYPTHQDYVRKFTAAAQAAYAQGFIEEVGLADSLAAAAAAPVP